MDLFVEARWTFSEFERVAYYQSGIQDLLVKPRLLRFGIMRKQCTEPCEFVIAYRTDPESIGYPANVTAPFALFADVGDLEYNDQCRICIEESYNSTIEDFYETVPREFEALRDEVLRSKDALEDTTENAKARMQLDDIATKLDQLVSTLTTDDMADFYSYYVARDLYGQLGFESYVELYSLLTETIEACQIGSTFFGMTCPPHPSEIDLATARQHLLNHADNAFSSVITSGAPMPFWSEADGTGALFQGNNETGTLYPVSGSGVNMSGNTTSLSSYLAMLYLTQELADPNSQDWRDLVEKNPQYSWFMAGLTPAEEGTSAFFVFTCWWNASGKNRFLTLLLFVTFVHSVRQWQPNRNCYSPGTAEPRFS